ncbi:hypothetical protein GCM10023319_13000 [Nocardia iowensis]
MQRHHLGRSAGAAQSGSDSVREIEGPRGVGTIDPDHAITGQREDPLDHPLDEGILTDRNEPWHRSIRANLG